MAGRLLTIRVRSYLATQPRAKRMRKAARYIRERVAHYTKADDVKFSKALSETISSVAKYLTPLKLNVEIDNGVATAKLFGEHEEKKPESQQKQGVKKEGAKKAPAGAQTSKPEEERAKKAEHSAPSEAAQKK